MKKGMKTEAEALSNAPLWQRQRVLTLHQKFQEIERRKARGEKIGDMMSALSAELDGRKIGPPKKPRIFKAKRATLFRDWKRWREGGRKAAAILPRYSPKTTGGGEPWPEDFNAEFHRRLTAQTGGRTGKGMVEVATVYKQVCREWERGEWIEGIGDWKHWWQTSALTKDHPLPEGGKIPDFPWTVRTFQRRAASDAIRKLGNVGHAAARNSLPRIELDYSKLRRCELLTLDDVRPDLLAIHEQSGRVCPAQAYFLMDVASRCIMAHVVKPLQNIRAQDVDELLVHGLQAPGFGVGVGYTTFIKFERGTVACSEAAKAVLESGSGGSIKVLRTGMDGTVRWVGAARDVGSGNAAGKAVIESWMRHGLHSRLTHLPGQRGNRWENAPANLGFAGNRNEFKPRKDADEEGERAARGGTVTQEADRLAQIAKHARELGVEGWRKITYPILTFAQLNAEIAKACAQHNRERGHRYRGHHKILQIETAPKVWEDAADVAQTSIPDES